jgi:hypothetical protein
MKQPRLFAVAFVVSALFAAVPGCGEDTPGAAEPGGQAGQAGSANLEPACSLAPDAGPCQALIRAFYHDAETDRCLPFIYGGCEGNANRYTTIGECLARCGGGTECSRSSECVVSNAGCCAGCEPVTKDDFIALHEDDAAAASAACGSVLCGPCPEPPAGSVPEAGNFFAQCVDQRCELRDVRETTAAACDDGSECKLRGGSGCCERCADHPVAISDESELLGWLECPEQACPPCVPSFEGYGVACDAGACRVSPE